jgi:hypothetical protein
VPKPQARKGRAPKTEKQGAENKRRQEVRLMRLEHIPIANAFHEKEMFEKGEDARKLNPEHFSGPVAISDETRRERIIEVYKRCFEEADLRARLGRYPQGKSQ